MLKTLTTAVAALLVAGTAHAFTATDFVVEAKADSTNGGKGTGLATTIDLVAGEKFIVTADTTDLWSAGSQEWSNANGLTGTVTATGSDDSAAAAGAVIGKRATSGSFYIGELVGEIGNGAYFAIGTSYTGIAATSGVLKLFEWDSSSWDNSGSVTAAVTVVPEPASVALMLAGVVMIAGIARRRAKNAA